MWILNVGDIKPAEYQIELFMDMAWNIEAVASEGVTSHLKHWLERELGASCAKAGYYRFHPSTKFGQIRMARTTDVPIACR